MTEAVQTKQQGQIQESPHQNDNGQRLLRLLTAGGLAGAVSRTATAPIDRLKFLLMVDNGAKAKNIRWGIQRIAAEGSITAFFKGNGTNVLKIAPETAIKLAMSDVLKAYIAQDPEEIQPAERFICGGLAGGTAQLVIYPMEVIKTRLMTAPPGIYSGLLDAACKIYQHEGCMSFYRGLKPNMVGIFPYAGVEIACFEILFEHLNRHYNNAPPASLIVAAGTCSATFAQFISYPFTVIKARLQADGVNGAPNKYRNMTDCFVKTLEKEGYRGFYKGLAPNFMKLAPAAGLSWLVFEWTKQFLGLNGQSAQQ